MLKPNTSSADLQEEDADVNIDYYLTCVSAALQLIQVALLCYIIQILQFKNDCIYLLGPWWPSQIKLTYQ